MGSDTNPYFHVINSPFAPKSAWALLTGPGGGAPAEATLYGCVERAGVPP